MPITRGNLSTRADGGAATTVTTTWGTAPLAGSLVVVAIWTGFGDTASITSVVDNGSPSRTLAQVAANTSSADDCWLYYADNVQPSGTYSVTATKSAAGAAFDAAGIEIRGAKVGGPYANNQNNPATAVTCTTPSVGSGTGNYYAAVLNLEGGANPLGILTTAPFTQEAVEQNGGGQGGALSDNIGNGSQACTWTWTNSKPSSTIIGVWAPDDAVGGLSGLRADISGVWHT